MKNLLLFSALLLCSFLSFSQSPITLGESHLPVVPQTPDVASIMKYQEVPVSKNSGIPQLDIPILTIPLDDISVPVRLSYHSGGVRVSEVAPWTGQGWNIIAGGSITRTVRHLSDDNQYGYIKTPITTSDIYDACVNGTGPYTCVELTNYKVRDQTLDFEPDIFSYSAPGIAGKFMFNQERDSNNPYGEIKSFPKTDNKITASFNTYHNITSWDITDTSGNVYHFVEGNTLTSTDSYTLESIGNLPQNYPFEPFTPSYTQTWNLSKITTYSGEEITFTYYSADTYTDCTFSGQSDSHSISSGQVNNIKTTYVESSGNSRQLSSISGDFGRVDFIRSASNRDDYSGKSLDEIKIFDRDNTLVRKYDLNYSYTTAASYPSYNIYGCAGNGTGIYLYDSNNQSAYLPYMKRMFLDEVVVFDNSSQESYKYAFDYYNDNPLPHRNSYAQDFWGYYNGANNNNTLLFNYTKKYTNYPYRHIEQDYAQSGLLKKITYPEGGSTKLFYENNRATTVSGNAFGFRLVPSDEKVINFHSQNDTHEYTVNGSYRYYTYRKPIILNGRTFLLDNELEGLTSHRRAVFYYAIDQAIDDSGHYVNICFTDPNSLPIDGDCSYWLTIRKTTLDPEAYDNESQIDMNNITYDTNFTPLDNLLSDDTEESRFLRTGVYVLEFIIRNHLATPQGPLFDIDDDLVTFDVTCRVAKDDINFYDSYNEVEIPVGGQRIKKIEEYIDATTLAKVREYKYVLEDSVKTSGRVLRVPYFIARDGTGISESSMSAVPLITTSAGNVNYTRVTEDFVDKNNSSVKLTGINTYRHYALPQIYENPMVPFMEDWRYSADLKNEIPLKSLTEKAYNDNFVSMTPGDPSTFHYAILPPTTVMPYKFSLMDNLLIDFFNTNYTYTGTDFYELQYGHLTQTYEIEKTYYNDDVNRVVTKQTDFNYDNTSYLQPTSIETTVNNNEKTIKKFYYPHDLVGSGEAFAQNLINENRVRTLLKEETYIQEGTDPMVLLSTQKIDYKNSNGLILPDKLKTSKEASSLETRLVFNSYDDDGNLLDSSKPNGVHTSYIWGYDGQYLVAKVENATYAQVTAAGIGLNMTTINDPATEAALQTELNKIRSGLPDAQVTTYTYKPLVGVSTITDPKGYQVKYKYDTDGRLEFIEDADGNLLSKNEYNYKN